MDLSDIDAVVASARARGTGSLERLVQKRHPSSSATDVAHRVDRAVRVIEEVPALLQRAEEMARSRGLIEVVGPILARAEEYFLRPVDLMPEMTQGLAGLVDDAYFVLRLLDTLESIREPLLGEDLSDRLDLLRDLTGLEVAERIDRMSRQTLLDAEERLRDAWEDDAVEA